MPGPKICDLYEVASGTTIGREHRDRLFKSNQDAQCVTSTPDALIVVVTDGCTSGEYSEFGARLGSRIIARTLQQNVMRGMSRKLDDKTWLESPFFWDRTLQDVLARLRTEANDLLLLGESFTAFVEDWLLFTALGMVATEEKTVFFAVGDGLIIINDERIVLDAPEHNVPPYLGYGLLDASQVDFTRPQLGFQLVRAMSTQQLQRFAVGVDGAVELVRLMDTPGVCFPGTQLPLGASTQLWDNDALYDSQSSQSLTLLLRRCNKAKQRINYGAEAVTQFPALLGDDTTLVVGRRRRRS